MHMIVFFCAMVEGMYRDWILHHRHVALAQGLTLMAVRSKGAVGW